MHKAIVWNKTRTRKVAFYFEHLKETENLIVFKIGTTDCETFYIPRDRVITIKWDNHILKRKGK